MNRIYELDVKLTDNLSLHYLENTTIANIFINSKEKNLLTKSADIMTFKGLLNIVAFYTQPKNYAINEDGIILYSDIIDISDDLYLQLEDNFVYYDELDDVIKNINDNYQVTLYLRTKSHANDIEIASYDLNQTVIHLFMEIEDYKTNKMYQNKIHIQEPIGLNIEKSLY